MAATLLSRGIPLQAALSRKFSQFASGFSMPMPKKLDEIMPVAMLQETEAGEIVTMWNNYHLGRTHLSTVLSAGEYNIFKERSQGCPMFVVPVLKPRGFVTMFTQVQIPHILVTGLEDYKVRGMAASPFLTVSHYSELIDSKELVLVRGDVVLPSKLSDTEAKALLQELHKFYIMDDRFKLVQDFNKNPSEFDFRQVVKAMGLPIQW